MICSHAPQRFKELIYVVFRFSDRQNYIRSIKSSAIYVRSLSLAPRICIVHKYAYLEYIININMTLNPKRHPKVMTSLVRSWSTKPRYKQHFLAHAFIRTTKEPARSINTKKSSIYKHVKCIVQWEILYYIYTHTQIKLEAEQPKM